MVINADTRISSLLKQHPEALDAIVSISPKFNALRNPVLRKIMAGRTSIAAAAKMGGCTVADFYNKLLPLGFEVENNPAEEASTSQTPKNAKPAFLQQLNQDALLTLDVRPVIEAGNDPLTRIQAKLKSLEPHQALLIINSFEPIPLIKLLNRQGFESFVENSDPALFHTYFYRPLPPSTPSTPSSPSSPSPNAPDFDTTLNLFKDRIDLIDVRALPMPLPMQTILQRLEQLKETHALFVLHKRIPVYLLPELAERHLNYLVREISDTEVHLLIYHAADE